MTNLKTFKEASRGLGRKERRELAMEYLEGISDPKEAWALLHEVGADIEDADVLHHLHFNPYLSYLHMERAE